MGKRILAVVLGIFVLLMSAGWVSGLQKTTLVKGLTQAENSVITSDGRLFVSADDNIFEIKRNDDGSFYKVKLTTPANYGICGMVQRGGFLYANITTLDLATAKMQGYLIAAPLNANPEFQIIFKYKNTQMLNGLTIDQEGYLYAAHSTGIVNGIIKTTINADEPLRVDKQTTWVGIGGFWPNGIRYANGCIYYTTAANLQRVTIKSDGTAGANKTLYTKVGFNDDFYVDNHQIILTDFISGRLLQLDLNGNLIEDTASMTFSGPSSIIAAKGPMFPNGGFLVTDKLLYTLNLCTVGS